MTENRRTKLHRDEMRLVLHILTWIAVRERAMSLSYPQRLMRRKTSHRLFQCLSTMHTEQPVKTGALPTDGKMHKSCSTIC